MSTRSFVGLQNQGATCYLNSLIQTLFLTPEFRRELFSLSRSEVGLDGDDATNHNNNNKSNGTNTNHQPRRRKRIIVELQKLFAVLQRSQLQSDSNSNSNPLRFDQSLSTKSLTTSFGWKAAEAQ